jgi:hypothetical protein
MNGARFEKFVASHAAKVDLETLFSQRELCQVHRTSPKSSPHIPYKTLPKPAEWLVQNSGDPAALTFSLSWQQGALKHQQLFAEIGPRMT